ncbi:MAG: sulfite dehydrogenase [Gemmatimonadota bacterium]
MPRDRRTKKPKDPPRHPQISRRGLLSGAVGALGAGMLGRFSGAARDAVSQAQTSPGLPVPPDATKVQGRLANELGQRSPFERPRRESIGVASKTPLQDLNGTITPADLHYERHHAGVAMIDPAAYTLLIHGMVERPMVFTLEDLKRLPSVSRVLFLECSGNLKRNAPEETRAQDLCGLTSTSEWTGVLLATLFREVAIRPAAKWFLAEGQDAALLARSIPVEKGWDDAMIAWGQNGEALRPENGYPARLICPGWEGNANVKWLRRLELSDRPFMTREETSKYTEALKGGKARQFSFVMDARSIITRPSYPQTLMPGWNEIRGLAWSGRGRIVSAELSFDEGATWLAAQLQDPVLPLAHTRFRYMWHWDGRMTTLLSRATDETGYQQPTQRALIEARGPGSGPYHLNPITGWRVRPNGTVVLRTEEWK